MAMSGSDQQKWCVRLYHASTSYRWRRTEAQLQAHHNVPSGQQSVSSQTPLAPVDKHPVVNIQLQQLTPATAELLCTCVHMQKQELVKMS